jgi:pSer/pThr/pTyr-binding forkhead associated (FHA) protein
MITFIEVLDGPEAGSRFQANENTTLGRTNADIVIQDSKISGTHARVQADNKGQLVLVDLDSINGIYVNSQRVKKVSLLQGVIFTIGKTQFRVVLIEEKQAKQEVGIIRSWRDVLQRSLLDTINYDKPSDIRLEGFTPPIRLKFITGIQTDEEVILGYGPRMFGSNCLDIELLDQEAPQNAFELHPGPGMVEFVNKAPGKVKLNQKSTSKQMLQDDDLISVGATTIKITYL